MFLSKQLIIVIVVSVVFGGLLGFSVSKYWLARQAEIFGVRAPVITNFEEGVGGDFLLETERKKDKVVLNWLEEVKVVQVRVYDLKDPRELDDHKIVFFLADFNLGQADVEAIIPKTLERFSPRKEPLPEESKVTGLSEPDAYLMPPYQVGVVPEGFYDNTPEKIKDIFKKDQHYLIEVGGIKDGEGLIAEYVFIF